MAPRILIFTHDGRGLGHLRRLSRLGKVLQKNSSVLFLTGHREASWLVPDECEYIHLPNLDSLDSRRSRQWGRKPFLTDETLMGRGLREELIRATIDSYKPDAIIMDYLALGINEEMRPFLSSMTGCRKYFIARGILGKPDQVHQTVLTPAALDMLRDHFNMILVMCDEKIIDVVSEYSLEEDIAARLTYVGYASETVSLEHVERVRAQRRLPAGTKWVVCSAGGGKEGESLINRCWETAQIFPDCYFDIVVGPRSRLLLESEVWHDGDRVHVYSTETRDMPALHAAADVVISRGGYNSLIEACKGRARILVAPILTDYEQVNHAARLAKYRPIKIVKSLGELDLMLEACLEESRRDDDQDRLSELQLDGLEVGSRVILSDLEIARALKRSRNTSNSLLATGVYEQSKQLS